MLLVLDEELDEVEPLEEVELELVLELLLEEELDEVTHVQVASSLVWPAGHEITQEQACRISPPFPPPDVQH